jgi:hypothetical protein
MAARLEQLAQSANPGVNLTLGADARIEYFRRQVFEARQPGPRLQLQARLGREMLNAGRTAEAIEQFLEMRQAIERQNIGGTAGSQLRGLLATAYLRQGEQDNCLARHGPDSCLLPIRGSGVHTATDGSRMALEELQALLRESPDDVASRWLLNLAYMTLGGYPDDVPGEWLIPPERFASDHDVGRFPNVASRLGVDMVGLSGGAIMEDFDGDGLLDLMASAWGMRDQLRYFRNNGDGTFEDRTEQAGLVGEVGGLNLNHADYDNDGDVDVLMLRGAWLQEEGRHPNSLLRNEGNGTFVDVTEEAGLLSFHPTQTAAWADFDNDGLLDLFIGNESQVGSHPCELYRNNGDGTFTDVAAAVGVAHEGFVKGVAWGDYDNDGLPDLYLSRMEQPNVLYRNEGPGDGGWSFRDVTAEAGVAEPGRSFPTWFWDYDNDGWEDLLVAPYPGFEGDSLPEIAADYLGLPCEAERPRLYRNNRDGTFRDVSREVGLGDALLAMGANFGDLDNDGFLDVYFGTGEPNLRTLVPNRMYRNAAGRAFEDVTTSGGFGHLQKGHGIGFGDLDNDGDLDIYAVMGGAYPGDVAYNALFLNPGHGNRWLTLDLVGTRSNRSAIGARIRVTVTTEDGEREIHRTVGTGGSFGSSSLRQEIGLGRAVAIREIRVTWPAGGPDQVFHDVAMDRAYRMGEGASRPVPASFARIQISP